MFDRMCWNMSTKLRYIEVDNEEMDNYWYDWNPEVEKYKDNPDSTEWVFLPYGPISVDGLSRRLRTALFFEHLGCRMTWSPKWMWVYFPYICRSVYSCFFRKVV